MNIKGEAVIQVRDALGNVIEETVETNDICWHLWRRLFYSYTTSTKEIPTRRTAGNQNVDGARWQMFYGSRDIKPTPLNAWYWHDGIVNVDQDFPTYVDGATATDPDVMTFTAVIPAPTSSSRTIRVIGLTSVGEWGSTAPGTDVKNAKFTILRLTTPCIQAINNTVTITYRLYLHPNVAPEDERVNGMLYRDIKRQLKIAGTVVGSRYAYLGNCAVALGSSAYNFNGLENLRVHSINGVGANQAGELTDKGLHTTYPTRHYHANAERMTVSYAANHIPSLGCFVKELFVTGAAYNSTDITSFLRSLLYNDVAPGLDTPVQSIFPQRANPPGPFQDLTVANTATMTGNILLTANNWVDPLIQRLARVVIEGTGPVGTAKYKLSVCNFIAGFVGNRWMPRSAILPQELSDYSPFRESANRGYYDEGLLTGSISYRSPDDEKYVVAASCLRKMMGINVYNIFSGECTSFNSANGLGVTAVSDCAVSNGYTFISCANTGLWRISPDFNTIEHITSPTGVDKAYQLSAKNDAAGTIWALFDGGLCKLTNPVDPVASLTWSVHNETTGTPTFTYAGITDGNWDKVTAMTIDPDVDTDDQFLFISSNIASTGSSYRLGFIWWSTGTGAAVNPSSQGVNYSGITWTLSNLLQTSDAVICTGGKWFLPRSYNTTDGPAQTVYHAPFGSNNLQASHITAPSYARAVKATFNGVSGVLYSDMANHGNVYKTSPFVSNAIIGTIPPGTTLSITSSYVEFMLREGPISYTTTMETSTETGNLSIPLIYLSKSNFIFSYEKTPSSYAVTPFMLPPTHAKYNIYRGAFWKDYGWDSVNNVWVLGGSAGRPTHSTVEPISVLDNIDISFVDGTTGTSFINTEFFSFVLGNGFMKDNGATYTANFAYSLDPTKAITFTGTVPQTPLGLLVDEPVTFQPVQPEYNGDSKITGLTCLQNKGILVTHTESGNNAAYNLASNQLIPASTEFDFRFKWISFTSIWYEVGYQYFPSMGLATGTTTHTWGLRFRYHIITDTLYLYNNTTLLAQFNAPSVDAEFRIARDANNVITCYYDGVAINGGSITSSSSFVVLANGDYSEHQSGWYDIKLTYTEGRRVLRIGDQALQTGWFDPKFSALTYTSQANDTKVLLGSGSPLSMTLDYSPASNPVSGAGVVKVAPGAAWLIFHDSEATNPVTVDTVAHFVI